MSYLETLTSVTIFRDGVFGRFTWGLLRLTRGHEGGVLKMGLTFYRKDQPLHPSPVPVWGPRGYRKKAAICKPEGARTKNQTGESTLIWDLQLSGLQEINSCCWSRGSSWRFLQLPEQTNTPSWTQSVDGALPVFSERDVWGQMWLPFHKNNSHLQNDVIRDMSLGVPEEAAPGVLLAV